MVFLFVISFEGNRHILRRLIGIISKNSSEGCSIWKLPCCLVVHRLPTIFGRKIWRISPSPQQTNSYGSRICLTMWVWHPYHRRITSIWTWNNRSSALYYHFSWSYKTGKNKADRFHIDCSLTASLHRLLTSSIYTASIRIMDTHSISGGNQLGEPRSLGHKYPHHILSQVELFGTSNFSYPYATR